MLNWHCWLKFVIKHWDFVLGALAIPFAVWGIPFMFKWIWPVSIKVHQSASYELDTNSIWFIIKVPGVEKTIRQSIFAEYSLTLKAIKSSYPILPRLPSTDERQELKEGITKEDMSFQSFFTFREELEQTLKQDNRARIIIDRIDCKKVPKWIRHRLQLKSKWFPITMSLNI